MGKVPRFWGICVTKAKLSWHIMPCTVLERSHSCYFLAQRKRCQGYKNAPCRRSMHACLRRGWQSMIYRCYFNPPPPLSASRKESRRIRPAGDCRHVMLPRVSVPSASGKSDEETVKREKESLSILPSSVPLSSLLILLQSPLSYCHAPLDKVSVGTIHQNRES